MKILAEKSEELMVGFGEIVDRVVCTPAGASLIMRKGHGGEPLERWSWMRVYDETRARFGRPLTLLAAEKIKEKVGFGDHVILVTNSVELDGPPGAAAIARALILGLGAIPVVITQYREGAKQERAVPQALIGAGVIPVKEPRELMEGNQSPNTALVRNWPPMSAEEAAVAAERLLDEFRPKAVITVEAVSHNRKGVRHGALGGPTDQGQRWNEILDGAKRRGILTIATGDNGNECGMGTIEDILRRHHRFCRDCGCPCGGGIVSAAQADIVIPANSSNHACYGIEACLAWLLDKPEVMHDEYTENRVLVNVADAGINDGATDRATPTIDGYSHEACIYAVGLLRQTVLMSYVELVRTSRAEALAAVRGRR